MSSTSKRYSRGDAKDGKIFWGYLQNKATRQLTREWWIDKDDLVLSYCRRIYSAAKQRAKSEGLPFSITPEYLASIFPTSMTCPITQKPMEFFGSSKNAKPSLDKIVPERGYVQGNVVWMSLEANRIKDNATIDILKRIVALVEEHKGH